MKTKKLSVSMKFLIAAIIVVILSMTIIGVSNIFAEPTIEDLVETPEIGTFEPSALLDPKNDTYSVVDWISVTQLFFDYDIWEEATGDDMICAEDAYRHDNFAEKMLMEKVTYPIFDPDPDSNYFLIAMPDYARYNGVVVQFKIGNNDDLANLKDESLYWFDHENNYVYIDKTLLADTLKDKKYATTRAECILLVKDVKTATKRVTVDTIFAEDIVDKHGLDRVVPNKEFECRLADWSANGFTYQLIPNNKLAYVSSDNLTVYINNTESEQWTYDSLSGEMKIYSSPYVTRFISVVIEDLEEADSATLALQYMQSQSSDKTGYCSDVTLEDALQGYNPFIEYIQYDDQKPVVGEYQEMDYTVTAMMVEGNNQQLSYVYNETLSSVATSYIYNVVDQVLKSGKYAYVNGHYQSTTLSATTENPLSSTTMNAVVDNYVQVVKYLYLAHSRADGAYINDAVNVAQSELLNNVGGWGDSALTATWYGRALPDFRYIVCDKDSEFLGGVLAENSNAFFDVTCGCITARAGDEILPDVIKEMEEEYGSASSNREEADHFDYRANATIIQVTENADGTGGDLYVCLWSQSIGPLNTERYGQRVLAFSKIAYKYDGSGKIRLTKTSADTNEAVSGAEYTIYKDASCTQAVETLTTSTVAVESSNLPAGKYYVKETAVPTGYLRDTNIHEVEVTGGSTQDLTVQDQSQKCDFSLTVYDQTTENATNKIPVPGIKFELLDPGGTVVNDNLVTDVNGKISGTVGATGDYTLRQVDTVTNYAMETDPNSAYYCYDITIYATPTNSGNNIACNLVHYEQRQSAIIKSHVQDENLLANTRAELGGDAEAGSYVSLIGAKYQLRTTSQILLGYYNGNAVTVNAEEVLKILTWDNTGNEVYSTTAVSHNDGEKAYVVAKGVQVTHAGQTLNFPLPNGQYQWELVDVSSGYYDNAAITAVDASWNKDNNTIKSLAVNGYPVKQVRQTVEINQYVKSYTDDDRTTDAASAILNNTIRNNSYTSLVPVRQALGNTTETILWRRFINQSITKTVTGNSSQISNTSTENATLYKNSQVQYAVKSSGIVPNAVYVLMNLCDIVDIETGKVVNAGTPLGVYLSDSNGKIRVVELGSNGFDNPNKEADISHFGKIVPQTVNNASAQGSLPNGVYGLSLQVAADGYKGEIGLSEDIMLETQWSAADSNKATLSTTTVTFLLYDFGDSKGVYQVPTAPDTPIDETDPYDPRRPDDSNNPDDSNDIELVGKEWVDANQYNLSYRIVDSENITGEGAELVYEVNDTLPATFAFYLKNDLITDEIFSFKYYLSFYYEISQAEYDEASESAKASEEYISVDGHYARRFKTDSLSGGDWLQDVIVLNQNSLGYINYGEMSDNKTISGAIFNTEWLNEKLLKQADGDYDIYVFVDITTTYVTKALEKTVTVEYEDRKHGTLTIKNRELVNLD